MYIQIKYILRVLKAQGVLGKTTTLHSKLHAASIVLQLAQGCEASVASLF